MPDQAKVTSIETLEAFRRSLILYLDKASRVLDEVSDEVVRTRLWLENEQRIHWQNQIRRRSKILDDKKQELFSARLSELKEIAPLEQAAVREAKRSLEEAEAKLALVKQWRNQYDHRVAPVAKEVDKLRTILDRDMRSALGLLAETVKTLDAYAEAAPPGRAPDRMPGLEQTPDSPAKTDGGKDTI